MSDVTLHDWLVKQPVDDVRALADGMPYRHESTKAEIIDWLLTYQPRAVERARGKSVSFEGSIRIPTRWKTDG